MTMTVENSLTPEVRARIQAHAGMLCGRQLTEAELSKVTGWLLWTLANTLHDTILDLPNGSFRETVEYALGHLGLID